MTRKDLIGAVAIKCSIPTAQAAKIIDATIGEIKHELIHGGVVALPGFGTFGIKNIAAREGVNPRPPHEKIQLPATKRPFFTASKSFKAAVKS